MFKTTSAKTPKEYIEILEEPRKSEIKKIHDFIAKTVPSYKPFIMNGMIGYGSYHYKSKSGREGDWGVIELASNKNYISIYICSISDKGYVAESYKNDLPKASIGKSCIRFKKFDDIDFSTLKKVLLDAKKYGGMNMG